MTAPVVLGSHPSWADMRPVPKAPHAVAGEHPALSQAEVTDAAGIGGRPEKRDMDLDDDVANLIRDPANMEYYESAE